MKIELGGGFHPRGEGFLNVDSDPSCHPDILLDLEEVGQGKKSLPWDDDTVAELYSAHCLEHVQSLNNILHEICRVCRAGARVEIRVPHWLSAMAQAPGHVHALPEQHWENITGHFARDWFPPGRCAKRLQLVQIHRIPGPGFGAWKGHLSGWSEDDVMRFCPDACHEIRVHFEVVANT